MSLRLVVVHERFTERGGSEQVVEHIASLASDVRVHAPIVDRRRLPSGLASAEVTTSWLSRLYPGDGRYAHLLPLLPLAMEHTDLSDADVVVASHHAFANRVRPPAGVPFISYTHTPARWLWDPTKRSGERGGRWTGMALQAFAASARRGDQVAAARAQVVIANSQVVADRIHRWWGRQATVIHPPCDVDRFTPNPLTGRREDFFLVAGRLVPYKRVEVAIDAANRGGFRLVVAGDGRSRAELARRAGPTVELIGAVSDAELCDLYRRCAALLFCGEEDFGIVPVEAQACGAPVIAHRAGGATETVLDGVTGVLADLSGPGGGAELAAAVRCFDPGDYDEAKIRRQAERFSADRFRQKFGALLAATVDGWS